MNKARLRTRVNITISKTRDDGESADPGSA